MQDLWYGDKRDLIKWGTLIRLADIFKAQRILQLAYYRPNAFPKLNIGERSYNIPDEVIAHFRNLRAIGKLNSRVRITVFDRIFQDRAIYQQAILSLLPRFSNERCIVFLDPDTGLEPQQNPGLQHVLNEEAKEIWDKMKKGDIFAFYQHQTNRNGEPWIEPKRRQLATALNISVNLIKMASTLDIARDVVLFYAQKHSTTK